MQTKMNVRIPDNEVLCDCTALLEQLINLPTPGTFEDAGQRAVAATMKQFCDVTNSDIYGNVSGVIAHGATTRLLLTAHIDEIALMVSHIDEQGFLYFRLLGGSRPDALVGQRVTVHAVNGPVTGVISRNTGQAPKDEITVEKLCIDIGAEDYAQATAVVACGDTATVKVGFERLLGDRVAGRAFDDRAGVAAMLAAMRLIARKRNELKVAVHGLSATQEEGGQHRGAITGAYVIQPHLCLAIDLGYATDYPNCNPKTNGAVRIGGGPMISYSLTTNRAVNRMLLEAAQAEKIPVQVSVEPRLTGTDGDSIASSRAGVATGVVSIPSRYMHSPSEIVSLRDVALTAELIAAFALRLPASPELRPLPDCTSE